MISWWYPLANEFALPTMNSSRVQATVIRNLLRGGGVIMRISVLAVSICLAIVGLSAATESQAVARKPTSIAAQGLGPALQLIAQHHGFQIVYVSEEVNGLRTEGAAGNFSLDEALNEILRGTGMTFRYVDENTVTVFSLSAGASLDSSTGGPNSSPQTSTGSSPSSAASPLARNPPNDRFLIAQTDEKSPVASSKEEPRTAKSNGRPELEEIVVTGTTIRGVDTVASPLTVLSAEDISESGAGTLYEALARLSQNFRGGVFENSQLQLSPSRDSNLNSSFGSGTNLRGLGNSSTLVLVNGHRMAPGGFASFVDISAIPISAVDRVEILADGASAIYGADAVAGVVNVILREHIDRPETRLRYGAADGGAQETVASQAIGTRWNNGSAFLVYDFYERLALENEDRAFAASSDLTRFGGDNFGLQFSHPGNILDFTAAPIFGIPSGQDGTTLTVADLLATPNVQNIKQGGDLIPGQKRHALTAQFNQQMGSNFSVRATALYSERDFEAARLGLGTVLFVPSSNPHFLDATGFGFDLVGYSFIDDMGPLTTTGKVKQLTSVFGADYQLSDWVVDAAVTYAESRENSRTDNWVNFILLNEALSNVDNLATSYDPQTVGSFNPYGAGRDNSAAVLEAIRGFTTADRNSMVKSITGKADGPLFDWHGGSVKASMGVELRSESYHSGGINFIFSAVPLANEPTAIDRDVRAIFGELLVPLVSADNRAGKIDFSVAARAEDYSDFGTTTNPKVGLIWKPTDQLAIRSTYGSSFRAPILSDMDPDQRQVIVTFFEDPASPTGSSLGILLAGNNPDLQPETANTFTLSAEYMPGSIDNLRMSIGFYDVQYDDRISQADDGFAVLLNPTIFADLINRAPSTAQIEELLSDPVLENFTGLPVSASDVSVIVDGRLLNLSKTSISGIDLELERGWNRASGKLAAGMEGTYRLNHKEQFSKQAPVVDKLGTIYNPPEWNARAWLRFERGPVTTTLSINHTDGYRDNLSSPSRSIDSWTTADLQAAYTTEGQSSRLLMGLEVRVTIRNLTDKDPPFVNNPTGVGFDPDNASPLGRFFSVELGKRW
jgi:iron complex outermembrane receptor protein